MGSKSWSYSFSPLYPSVLIPCLGIAILILASFALRDVNAAATVHNYSRNLPKLTSPDDMDEQSGSRLIDQLSAAILNYPDDPEVHLALANLLIYRFRLQELQMSLREGSQQKK